MVDKEYHNNPIIEGDRIYLRKVTLSDVDGDYFEWMNNSKAIKFLSTRGIKYTREIIKKHVSEINGDSRYGFFAIIDRESEKHIGNIKIGPIDEFNRIAPLGIMIGGSDFLNKGYATEAIKLIVKYSFEDLRLNKFTAGCFALNTGAINAFKKAGFLEEGLLRKQEFLNGEFADGVLLGILIDDFEGTNA